MALWISSAALFLLVHFLTSSGSLAPDAVNGTATPKWTVDLHPAVASDPLGSVQGRKREWQGRPRTSLWFLDNSTILATFITREGTNPSLASRDSSDPNQPLRLRTVFLQAETGIITFTQAWPSESRVAGIVAVNDGKFVTQTGTTLTLYSSEAKKLKKLSLPALPEDVGGWHAHPSVTGRSILFATGNLMATSPKPWIWVDTNSLQILHSWNEVQSGWIGISDSSVAMTACLMTVYHCDPHVEVRGIETQWRAIAPLEKQAHWGSSLSFVNDEMLFLSGEPWRLLQSDGRVVLTGTAKTEGSTALTSAGGQRFVVPFFKLVGKVQALDIGGHGDLKTIAVYDAPFHERSYKLEVKGPKIRSISDKSVAQLALSPDGSKLAILYEESVYLFQLPPPPSTQHTDTVDPKNGNFHLQVPVPATVKPKPQAP
jgi:hypothetical protein